MAPFQNGSPAIMALVMLMVTACNTMAACNTMEGLGEDVERAGGWIEEKASGDDESAKEDEE